MSGRYFEDDFYDCPKHCENDPCERCYLDGIDDEEAEFWEATQPRGGFDYGETFDDDAGYGFGV